MIQESLGYGLADAGDFHGNFPGMIDELSAYNQALSDEEVETLYAGARDGGLRAMEKWILLAPPPLPEGKRLTTQSEYGNMYINRYISEEA